MTTWPWPTEGGPSGLKYIRYPFMYCWLCNFNFTLVKTVPNYSNFIFFITFTDKRTVKIQKFKKEIKNGPSSGGSRKWSGLKYFKTKSFPLYALRVVQFKFHSCQKYAKLFEFCYSMMSQKFHLSSSHVNMSEISYSLPSNGISICRSNFYLSFVSNTNRNIKQFIK